MWYAHWLTATPVPLLVCIVDSWFALLTQLKDFTQIQMPETAGPRPALTTAQSELAKNHWKHMVQKSLVVLDAVKARRWVPRSLVPRILPPMAPPPLKAPPPKATMRDPPPWWLEAEPGVVYSKNGLPQKAPPSNLAPCWGPGDTIAVTKTPPGFPSRPRVTYSRDGVVSMNDRAMVTAMKWLDLIERLIPEEDIKARQCPQPLVHG